MKKLLVVLGLIFITSLAYADKVITITLTDEEYKAMSALTQSPEQWANNAVKNKAQKMLNELVEKYSDKQADKISDTEKSNVINSIDIEKEKESRKAEIKK